MDFSKYIRNSEKIHAALQELDDKSVVALKECKIYIPKRWAERGMAEVGVDNTICGIYIITVENAFYGISTVPAMIHIEPTAVNKVLINEEEHYEFYFEPGATVFSSTMVVKDDSILFKIYDEFFAKGHLPFFLLQPEQYDDVGKIYDLAPQFTGTVIGRNQETIELLVSIVARDATDRTRYYRETLQGGDLPGKKQGTQADVQLGSKLPPIAYIPLKSVQYAATNTLNKLAGSYFEAGTISALVEPATRVEPMEAILRA